MNLQNDSNIPTLTEVIPVVDPNATPPSEPAIVRESVLLEAAVVEATEQSLAPVVSATEAVPVSVATSAAVAAPTIPDLSRVSKVYAKEEWERLEHEVSERVLTQMMNRIDFVLEQRIRDSLADALQTAMGALSDEIRKGLQQTLEEVVSRAVTQEIVQLQKQKT